MKNIRTLLTALAVMLSLTDANATTFTSNAVISVGNTTYDGADIIVQGCTLTVDGAHAFASLSVTSGGVLTHSPAPNGEADNRVDLTIVGNASVDATSAINMAGRGYAANKGPGAGGQTSWGNSGGGGHAGNGGNAIPSGGGGAIYGSIPEPGTHGSGGNGQGGAGGGVIRLAVGGTLLVDGVISASGNNASGATGGGGAGGSVFLSAGTLAGTGTIRADGGNSGNSSCGGGGGGRLALLADTLGFSGSLSAIGGTGYEAGGAGTIFTRVTTETYGRLRVDNAGRSGYTRIGFANWPTGQVYALSLSGAAIVVVSLPITVPQLDITSGAMLTHERLCGQPLRITVLGPATISTGASINVDGAGYYGGAWNQFDRGPGVGGTTGTNGMIGGGGYGGCGGLVPGITYGSYQEPLEFGSTSADSGSYGGGSVRLTVAGTLTVDGTISAGGQAGGAGGSIFLTAATLTGAGSIRADGGTAINTSSGGGGGGRVALLADTLNFSGSLAAIGGTGGPAGGAGTVFTRVTAEPYGQLSLDNAGRSGYTRLNASIWPAGQVCALRIAGAAIVIPSMPITVTQLDITTGAMLTHERLCGQPLRITVLGPATISTGASINVDGAGYYQVAGIQSDRGPGAGGTSEWGGAGGAGHGGPGGAGIPKWGGGATYGSYQEPVAFGSASTSNGSYGGGSVRLAVGGTLTVDGTISAGGQGGGAAGGSVYLACAEFAGGGNIQANGAAGSDSGNGGGGGGRIAVYSATTSFLGTKSVAGGAAGGFSAGGVGTIYLSTSVPPQFTSAAPPSSGMVGTAYNHTCTAAGSSPITFTVSTGNLPTGLILGAGGVISGTPGATGTFSGTITAANGILPNATQDFSITIAPAPVPPTITTVRPLPAGTVGAAYTQSLSATAGTTPYTWTVSTGSLPSGLFWDNGTITGTPNAAGNATFTVRVTGNNGASSTMDLSLSILPASAELGDLVLSGCVLSPLFSPEVTSYTAITYAADLSVTPTTGGTGALIEVRCNSGDWLPAVPGVALDGLILHGGSNTVETRVTAAGGTPVKTYTVMITRWVPLIEVSAGSEPLVDDAVAPLAFGPATTRRVATQTLTISNAGTGELILGTVGYGGTNASDFTASAPLSATVAPGDSTTLTITFNPGGIGTKTATIHLASNVGGATNPFDVRLTGIGLGYTNDTDGDGMTDGAEHDLAALGFDWQVKQQELVATLYGGADGAGLYTASQVQALSIGTPLLKRDPVSGQFKLTVGVSKSTDLNHFTPFPMSASQTSVNANGEFEFHFNSADKAAFFWIEAK